MTDFFQELRTRFRLMEHEAMTRLGLVLLSSVLAAPAQAEQFSIKCIWNPAPTITFDEESKRVIWETPYAPSHKGIVDSETEDEIRFHIIVGPSRGDRIWNRKTGSLVPAESPNDPKYEITASSPNCGRSCRYTMRCFRTD